MNIKVLGPGCAKCDKTVKRIKEVISETGADAGVEKVTEHTGRGHRRRADHFGQGSKSERN